MIRDSVKEAIAIMEERGRAVTTDSYVLDADSWSKLLSCLHCALNVLGEDTHSSLSIALETLNAKAVNNDDAFVFFPDEIRVIRKALLIGLEVIKFPQENLFRSFEEDLLSNRIKFSNDPVLIKYKDNEWTVTNTMDIYSEGDLSQVDIYMPIPLPEG